MTSFAAQRPRPSMHEVHTRGGHKKVPSQRCPDCRAERDAKRERGLATLAQRETAVKRLHARSCSVVLWEVIGSHHCRPRPACNCGAEKTA
jgi:hypothetical protein